MPEPAENDTPSNAYTDGGGRTLTRTHHRRLRQVYRSAGWPYLDNIEIDLLADELLERVRPTEAGEYLRLTDAGIRTLSAWRDHNRRSESAHERLAARVADHQAQQGRLTYRELMLRARPDDRWIQVRPDVYSIRSTSVAAYLAPVVHEIKVSRNDLLSDLNKPDKGSAYKCLSAQSYYVLTEGIADSGEIPADFGVMIATDDDLTVARTAPTTDTQPDFSTWMALARATPVRPIDDPPPML